VYVKAVAQRFSSFVSILNWASKPDTSAEKWRCLGGRGSRLEGWKNALGRNRAAAQQWRQREPRSHVYQIGEAQRRKPLSQCTKTDNNKTEQSAAILQQRTDSVVPIRLREIPRGSVSPQGRPDTVRSANMKRFGRQQKQGLKQVNRTSDHPAAQALVFRASQTNCALLQRSDP